MITGCVYYFGTSSGNDSSNYNDTFDRWFKFVFCEIDTNKRRRKKLLNWNAYRVECEEASVSVLLFYWNGYFSKQLKQFNKFVNAKSIVTTHCGLLNSAAREMRWIERRVNAVVDHKRSWLIAAANDCPLNFFIFGLHLSVRLCIRWLAFAVWNSRVWLSSIRVKRETEKERKRKKKWEKYVFT